MQFHILFYKICYCSCTGTNMSAYYTAYFAIKPIVFYTIFIHIHFQHMHIFFIFCKSKHHWFCGVYICIINNAAQLFKSIFLAAGCADGKHSTVCNRNNRLDTQCPTDCPCCFGKAAATYKIFKCIYVGINSYFWLQFLICSN